MVVYTEPDIKQSGQLCETPWGPRSSGFTACQLVLVIWLIANLLGNLQLLSIILTRGVLHY